MRRSGPGDAISASSSVLSRVLRPYRAAGREPLHNAHRVLAVRAGVDARCRLENAPVALEDVQDVAYQIALAPGSVAIPSSVFQPGQVVLLWKDLLVAESVCVAPMSSTRQAARVAGDLPALSSTPLPRGMKMGLGARGFVHLHTISESIAASGQRPAGGRGRAARRRGTRSAGPGSRPLSDPLRAGDQCLDSAPDRGRSCSSRLP
jgi:hypothetical protein